MKRIEAPVLPENSYSPAHVSTALVADSTAPATTTVDADAHLVSGDRYTAAAQADIDTEDF